MDNSQDTQERLEEQLRSLVAQARAGASQDQILALMMQVLFEHGMALRSLETSLKALQGRVESMTDRRAAPTDISTRRASFEPLQGATVIKGKRRTDQCSFCGKNSTQVEAVYSSPNGTHICTSCIDTFNALRS